MHAYSTDNYKIVKFGYLRISTNSNFNLNDLTMENVDGTNIIYTEKTGDIGEYTYNYHLATNLAAKHRSNTIYTRAVAEFENTETGEIETVYSNVMIEPPIR